MKKFDLKDFLNRNKRLFFLAGILVVFVLGVVIILLVKENGELKNEIDLLKAQKEELAQVMQKDKTEMQEQITLLSNQVAEQLAKDEEEAEKHYPNGLPVTGKVTINSKPNLDPDVNPEELPDRELRKIVIFGAQNGAKVIAAGSGKVLSIKSDTEFGHVVRIDHGNGYITVYRYNDSPKVKEGDDVTKGQLLFEVNFVNSRVGYQVQYDKEFIDPMDVMEISG
ncbi:MAG: M23 family metallopeptidase [Lachnospiraceae bacterium]|nr:M23 family metallopeptidase [Lachnospiraceae bacterium]